MTPHKLVARQTNSYPQTYYIKTNDGYKVYGLINGFPGFPSTGLYMVNIYDGGKYDDCVKLICDFTGMKSASYNDIYPIMARHHNVIKNFILNELLNTCGSAYDMACNILRYIYDLSYLTNSTPNANLSYSKSKTRHEANISQINFHLQPCIAQSH